MERGAGDAIIAFDDAVLAPLMDRLAPAQREFVKAACVDEPAPAAVSDIAKRCGKSASWASRYRASLIKEHTIEAEGRGYVQFCVPHLADYLKRSFRQLP